MKEATFTITAPKEYHVLYYFGMHRKFFLISLSTINMAGSIRRD